MFLLEKPFLSKEMRHYIEETRTPVLKNAFAEEQGLRFCCDGEQFGRLYRQGERIYTNSENALEWINRNIRDDTLLSAIALMKDKAALRRALSPLDPDFFYMEVTAVQLETLDFSVLKLPFVLKPSVGFFSEGVYTVESKEDWEQALREIKLKSAQWAKQYPGSVVGSAKFILEQYIDGEEFAIDAYFDDNGQAVVLNIMKHDFNSSSDVSDRLYYTGKRIIEENLGGFTAYLDRANRLIGARNFPAHIEVRRSGGVIRPIEFNPMRFAGLCTTDITSFAYGFFTYDYYLKNRRPDWDTLLRGREGKLYTLILLNTMPQTQNAAGFDYDKLCKGFEKVLCLRKTDHRKFPAFGFLFTETREENMEELHRIMASDLSEFIL